MPPTTESIRALQRSQTDYFHFWRLGQADRYNRVARREAIGKIVFPAKGNWPGFERTKDKPVHAPAPIDEIWQDHGPRRTEHRAAEVAQQMATRMEVVGFRLVKILGWGGLGVATLFEKTDEAGVKTKLVCKLDLSKDDPYIADEIVMHLVSFPFVNGQGVRKATNSVLPYIEDSGREALDTTRGAAGEAPTISALTEEETE